MNMRRAMRINRVLMRYATAHLMDREEFLSPAESFLRGVSLLEMAEATEKVTNAQGIGIEKDGETFTSIFWKCDPRAVAAIYCLLWFDAEQPGQPEPIMVGNRCALFSVEVPWPERGEVEDG